MEYASFRAARAAFWAADRAADSCDAAKRWKKQAIEAVKEYEELTK